MGTPAITDNAYAQFATAKQAASAFALFQTFVVEANAGQHGGDFSIEPSSLECSGDCIYFDANSQREQNLDWQLGEILTFFRAQPGLVEFNASVLVQGDGVYWTPDLPTP